MDYSTILLLLLFIIVILYFFLNPKHNHHKLLPPGPKPWPIIGNIHLLGNKPHVCLTKLSQVYGPMMSLKLGNITTIVISSPDFAREMFTKHDLAFSSRPISHAVEATNHAKFSMVWLPVCPKWRALRKITTIQLFTTKSLDINQGVRQKKVDELIEFVRHSCEKGDAIDIGEVIFTTTLNFLSNTFFSFDLWKHGSQQSIEFKHLIRCLMEAFGRPNVSDFFPVLKWMDLQGVKKKCMFYYPRMLKVFEDIVDQRLRNSSDSTTDDVLGHLLHFVRGKELTLDDVKHMLMDLFAAGTDTTSSTVEWAMTELLRHPEKMAKAQTELNQVIGKDGLVQESNIPNLPYIQAIVKETLRLHPATAFLIPHKAVEDVHLFNYDIPKDAQVWVNVWSMGRDPSIWPNSESFLPERFLGNDIDMKGQHFEFIPFGAGRRICPGLPLAYRMVHLILAKLIYSFNWKLADGINPKEVDMEETFGITLQKNQPLRTVPYPK